MNTQREPIGHDWLAEFREKFADELPQRGPVEDETVSAAMADLDGQHAVEGYERWVRSNTRRAA